MCVTHLLIVSTVLVTFGTARPPLGVQQEEAIIGATSPLSPGVQQQEAVGAVHPGVQQEQAVANRLTKRQWSNYREPPYYNARQEYIEAQYEERSPFTGQQENDVHTAQDTQKEQLFASIMEKLAELMNFTPLRELS